MFLSLAGTEARHLLSDDVKVVRLPQGDTKDTELGALQGPLFVSLKVQALDYLSRS